MKKFACLFLIFLYVLLVMEPFIPYVEYTLLKDYISEFLCINQDKPELNCHGKCYLNKQLKEVNDIDPEPKQIPKPRVELKQFSILVHCKTGIDPAKNKKMLFALNDLFIQEIYSDIPTPPPRNIVS